MKHLSITAWTVCACALGAIASQSLAQVQLRGGVSIDAPVIRVSIQGVEVGGDDPRIITWDRVRRVKGEHAEESAPFLPLAEQAWRARTRLERGDVTLAQPIFEDLFNRMKGENGPTARVVAAGLLRCRLANLSQAQAVEPWLEAIRLGGTTSLPVIEGETPLIDSATGLAPGLPPVWLASPSIERLVSQLSAVSSDNPKIQRYRTLYLQAAQQSLGQWDQHIAAQDEPGAKLIASMIAALSDDPTVRDSARRQLRAGLTREPNGWKETWRRMALGRSLLLEESLTLRRQGMIHLLHIPARFQSEQPYLAGVAMAIVADELRQESDDAGAKRLINELKQLNPAHPALSWWNHHEAQPRRVVQSPAPTQQQSTQPNHNPDATSTRLATDKERR